MSRSDSYIDGEVDIESVADAVIRELQLREENGWFGPTNIPKHRHVTDWVMNGPPMSDSLRTRIAARHAARGLTPVATLCYIAFAQVASLATSARPESPTPRPSQAGRFVTSPARQPTREQP